MTNASLLDNLKILNKINENDLLSIVDYIEDIISSNISRSLQNGENEISIDLGIGEIIVRIFSDSMYYNFRPSKSLENKVAKSSIEGTNYLAESMDEKISLKLYKIYRELLK